MKFIDEANIYVTAGKGGDGCLSFRREKFIPRGGPDGGDGGDGGSIFLKGNHQMNTLIDFRYKRKFNAENGRSGRGADCRGKSGEDLVIDVPLGTLVYDAQTQELIFDVMEDGKLLLIAQGGFHGLGNTRFKSSVNRAPRQTTKGTLGETRQLRLELKILADIGLIGMPNAGKSTLIRAVSHARPKVADYPFTTLHPNLGVVRLDENRSFVMADIPGVIEGASEGAGLGLQFLKHMARTKILLHVLDVLPLDGSDPVEIFQKIELELGKFSEELIKKPRWLVLNKVDLLNDDERDAVCDAIVKRLNWKAPVFQVSALQKMGTDKLIYAISDELLESQKETR